MLYANKGRSSAVPIRTEIEVSFIINKENIYT